MNTRIYSSHRSIFFFFFLMGKNSFRFWMTEFIYDMWTSQTYSSQSLLSLLMGAKTPVIAFCFYQFMYRYYMFFSIKYSEENIFSNSQFFLYYNESILLQLNACYRMSIYIILKFSEKYLLLKYSICLYCYICSYRENKVKCTCDTDLAFELTKNFFKKKA